MDQFVWYFNIVFGSFFSLVTFMNLFRYTPWKYIKKPSNLLDILTFSM
jgi:hypothetical protein